MEELEHILGRENVKYNESMSRHTTFKVGGDAEIFAIVDTEEKLMQVIKLGKKVTIIGNGSNLLVTDKGINGIVLKYINKDYEIKELENGEYELEFASGITNARIANIALQNELTGYEFAAGIPGTLGGALVMNAGAYGMELKDVVVKTKYLDLDTNEIKIIDNKEHEFEYRKSIFQEKNTIILKSTLKLKKGKKDEIQELMNSYAKKRIDSQPLNMPSAGSTFKRGTDFITAKLIDEAGLKGFSIGGAEVSEKHAGFIVNKGNASAKDILNLIDYVKKEVLKKFGKQIETEIKIIGERD